MKNVQIYLLLSGIFKSQSLAPEKIMLDLVLPASESFNLQFRFSKSKDQYLQSSSCLQIELQVMMLIANSDLMSLPT